MPTVFGETDFPNTNPDGDDLVVETEDGTVAEGFEVPTGIAESPVAPLVIPRLGIGTLLGTDRQLRYFPQTKLSFAVDGSGKGAVFGLAVHGT